MPEIIIKSKKHGIHTVVFDVSDANVVGKHKWFIVKKKCGFYAETNQPTINGKKKTCLRMHRVLLGAPIGSIVDHRDGNGLNNRRNNIRICTNAQNVRNSKPRKDTITKYKGVAFIKQHSLRPYRVTITVNGKQITGGFYASPIDAAKRYNELAIFHFGEFAGLNVIPE